jgi:hypothetical protein
VVPDAVDLFLSSMKPYLVALKMSFRLDAQQQMLQILSDFTKMQELEDKQ